MGRTALLAADSANTIPRRPCEGLEQPRTLLEQTRGCGKSRWSTRPQLARRQILRFTERARALIHENLRHRVEALPSWKRHTPFQWNVRQPVRRHVPEEATREHGAIRATTSPSNTLPTESRDGARLRWFDRRLSCMPIVPALRRQRRPTATGARAPRVSCRGAAQTRPSGHTPAADKYDPHRQCRNAAQQGPQWARERCTQDAGEMKASEITRVSDRRRETGSRSPAQGHRSSPYASPAPGNANTRPYPCRRNLKSES